MLFFEASVLSRYVSTTSATCIHNGSITTHSQKILFIYLPSFAPPNQMVAWIPDQSRGEVVVAWPPSRYLLGADELQQPGIVLARFRHARKTDPPTPR